MGFTANRSYEDHLVSKGYHVVHSKQKKLERRESSEDSSWEWKWECDFCKDRFRTKKEAEKHEKRCRKYAV